MKNKRQKVTNGVVFTRTKLGQPVFIKENAKSALDSISTDDWTISQLRAMADYMEKNPRCGLYSDGSGKMCRE